MRQALHAEWTKLRTVAGPMWLLAAVVLLTVVIGVLVVTSMTYWPGDATQDTTKLSLAGVDIGQAVAAIIGVMCVSSEYSSGLMRLSLTAVPRRWRVLVSKAVFAGGLSLAAGAVAVVASVLLGQVILAGHGFTAAHGYAVLSLAHGPTLRAAVGSAIYLALIALLGLGVATAVRDSATSIGVVLGLLFIFPLVGGFVSDPQWHRHLEQIGPMTAGLGIQSTIGLSGLTLTPWSGLGVTAAWAAGALLVGGLMLQFRDA
jgi:ABC-2 type transport system permease protein